MTAPIRSTPSIFSRLFSGTISTSTKHDALRGRCGIGRWCGCVSLLLCVIVIGPTQAADPIVPHDRIPDQPITETQDKLLTLAFESVSKMPLIPHHKDRARYQSEVVDVCLQLDQPRRTYEYALKIQNWRRGGALADYVIYCRKHGANDGLTALLERADRAAANPGQQWRRDYVRVRIAKAYTLMGLDDKAQEYATGVVDSEIGKLEQLHAKRADEKQFEDLMQSFDLALEKREYNLLINALETCVLLYERFYDDAERRKRVMEVIDRIYTQEKMPIFTQMDVFLGLTEVALDHEDQVSAKLWFDKAFAAFKNASWPVENYITIISRLARYRGRVGGADKAREDLKGAMDLFNDEKQRRTIDSIDRAGVLRKVAETYFALGDEEEAARIYHRAVKLGADNPNARIRAIDLSQACLSMALNGFEPDAKLWTQMQQINEGLGPPW